MKTKEEILSTYLIPAQNYDQVQFWDTEYTHKAMDEYAKEVAIDFKKWIDGYFKNYDSIIRLLAVTPEQLFELYLKHKNT